MRTAWRRRLVDGLALSVPVAGLLLATQFAAPAGIAQLAAVAAALITIPWIMPAWVVLAALSSPLFVWLVAHGHPLDVMTWLGRVVLVAAVIGCHVNGVLLTGWRRRRREPRPPQAGLGDFLRRARGHRAGMPPA